jgi:hypothetical protein
MRDSHLNIPKFQRYLYEEVLWPYWWFYHFKEEKLVLFPLCSASKPQEGDLKGNKLVAKQVNLKSSMHFLSK